MFLTLSENERNLVGLKFGRLLAIGPIERKKSSTGGKRIIWLCECQCGNTAQVSDVCLRFNGTKSCGCAVKDHALRNAKRLTKHGLYKSPEYETWKRMRRRCNDTTSPEYKNYGGRGIRVCDEWQNDFRAFFEAIGPRPTPLHTLDRKNNNRGYEPGNVRWATRREQGNNRRTTRLINIGGMEKSVSDWCRHFQVVSRDVAFGRMRTGWDPVSAMTLPLGMKKPAWLAQDQELI